MFEPSSVDVQTGATTRTPIIGREREIAQVTALIDEPGNALVTLLGPGGIGKTRLAIEIAQRIGGDFADGATFVPLASVREASLVPLQVARTLGLQESGDLSAEDNLTRPLRSQHRLLVLDNMEQVIDAASPWLSNLLHNSPRLKVVVTSRLALNIEGEQRFVVPPLETPAAGATMPPSTSAVDLFTRQARRFDSQFALNKANADVVAEICRRVHGFPLAIELAAARTGVLSPQAILDRLAARTAPLTSVRRDVSERQRSMHAAIGWSYDLLPEPERRLFCRLAVFVGSFSLDAVRFVSGFPDSPAGEDETLALITTLVDSSLAQPMIGESAPRYWMYEPLRDFGLERLVAERMDHDARDAHAAYYLKLGEEAEPGLIGPKQASWLATLDLEHGNLHEALTWLTAEDRVSEAVALSYNLKWVSLGHARHTEARQFLRAWLERPELRSRTRTRAMALLVDGILAASVYEASAIATLQEALGLFQELGDEIHEMQTLVALGFAHIVVGELERAQNYLDQGQGMTMRIGDARFKAVVPLHRGQLHRERGNLPDALQHLEQALSIAREAGDLWSIGAALGELGRVELSRGENLGLALELVNDSLAINLELGDKRGLPVKFEELADIARAQGDLDAAEAHLRTGLALCQETGQPAGAAYLHLGLATVARLRNQPVAWIDELRHAIRGFAANGVGVSIAECLNEFAAFAQKVGDGPTAARFLGAAGAIAGPSTSVSISMPNWAPGMHAQLIDDVRADLGEERFGGLVAEGQSWSMTDAIAAALAYAPDAGQPARETLPAPDHGLSPREMEVLRLMADGRSNQQIAGELFISFRTAGNHVTNILGKLGVASRTSAVSYAIRHGIA